jgi:hypothetical protein
MVCEFLGNWGIEVEGQGDRLVVPGLIEQRGQRDRLLVPGVIEQ